MTVTKIHRQQIPNDFENNELLNVVLQHLIEEPVINTSGKVYYNSFKKIPYYSDGSEWIPFFGKPVQFRYLDQASLLAEQPIHNNGYLYYQEDIDTYFEYLGTTNGDMSDYNPVGGTGGFVPYVGAVKNVDLGVYGLTAEWIKLNTAPIIPTGQGSIYWDESRSTAALIMNGTLQHVGQDSFFYVKNSTGSPINKGVAVGFAGTDGASGHLLIQPFLADGSMPSSYFMGVTAEQIGNGEFGQVMHFGELEGVNTSGYDAGDLLYVSTTNAGEFQTTAPTAPNNIILAAAAVNSKNNGAIIVRPQIGSNINNDEGVKITSPSTGQLLQLQANGLWENKTLAQILGGISSQFVKGDGSLDSNNYVISSRRVDTGTGLTGGGDLSVNRTISLTGQALSFHGVSGDGFVYRTSGIVGTRAITQGDGISVTNGNGISGNPVITNTDRGSSQNIFKNIAVQTSTITATNNNDTLTLVGGTNITITTNSLQKRITINATDTNTTYSAGTGLTLVGTEFRHLDTSSQGSVNNSGGTVIQDITLDGFGHITAIGSVNLDNRYLQSFTETDPTVPSHVKNITTTNISNWNTAYGWGNHANAGYAILGTNSGEVRSNADLDARYPRVSNSLSDFNNLTTAAFVPRFHTGSFQANNAPSGANYWSSLTFRHQLGGVYETSLLTGSTGSNPEMYIRNRTNGVWGSYRRFWHSGNVPEPFSLTNGDAIFPSQTFVGTGTGASNQYILFANSGSNVHNVPTGQLHSFLVNNLASMAIFNDRVTIYGDVQTYEPGTSNADSRSRWRLGRARTASAISATRLVRVEIGGVEYDLLAIPTL